MSCSIRLMRSSIYNVYISDFLFICGLKHKEGGRGIPERRLVQHVRAS